ncbi:MAG: methyl-accepting chemotaxis protein [Lachnospiraceae bacterium]|nr:methyl-accepting chemotaxis protein [Lachnospiraceae bacterium]
MGERMDREARYEAKRAKLASADIHGKIPFFKSIALKIAILAVVCAAVATGISVIIFSNLTKEQVKTSVENNIGDLATSYAALVNDRIEEKGELTYDDYNELLSAVKIKGMSSSYAYMVSSEGVTLYHPTKDRVGNQVENEVVKGLVAELKAGKTPEDGVVTYLFKGANKIAGYSILSDRSILVVTADEKDAFSFMSSVRKLAVGLFIGIVIIAGGAAAIFSMMLTKPMTFIKDMVVETAEFNFVSKGRAKNLQLRSDELGSIARALKLMRDSLRGIVGEINVSSDTLDARVNQVSDSSIEIDSMCSDASSTTEELAEGMEETSASADSIQANIQQMNDDAEVIQELSHDGQAQAVEIKNRAVTLKSDTEAATNRATSLYEDMKARTDKALADSQAVKKINALTEAIMEISSQTSLLALNANIEAARAGEAGRGFAVVATEIGALANQTSNTVTGINEIVDEVNEVVARMSETLTEAMDFLENVVIKDYDSFSEVSAQYMNDAETFKFNMENIDESVSKLTGEIAVVAEALQKIAGIVGESSFGVTDIAGKTQDITALTIDNRDAVAECMDAVKGLREIASRFKMNES